jgi:3-hydroxybutyryl-CoA dehydratase
MSEPPALPVRRGFFFEEFAVGQSVTSPARTITESDVISFAALSGDWNAIHSDAVSAAQGPFGQRVAHGLLVMSIAVGLASRLGFIESTVLAFREIGQWKFSQPVFFNETIRLHATVSETRLVRRLNAGLVTLQVEIRNQNDQIVQQGTWSMLVKSQSAV